MTDKTNAAQVGSEDMPQWQVLDPNDPAFVLPDILVPLKSERLWGFFILGTIHRNAKGIIMHPKRPFPGQKCNDASTLMTYAEAAAAWQPGLALSVALPLASDAIGGLIEIKDHDEWKECHGLEIDMADDCVTFSVSGKGRHIWRYSRDPFFQREKGTTAVDNLGSFAALSGRMAQGLPVKEMFLTDAQRAELTAMSLKRQAHEGSKKLIKDDGTADIFVAGCYDLNFYRELDDYGYDLKKADKALFRGSSSDSAGGTIFESRCGPWDVMYSHHGSDEALVGRIVDAVDIRIHRMIRDGEARDRKHALALLYHTVHMPMLEEDGTWLGEMSTQTVHQYNELVRAKDDLAELGVEVEPGADLLEKALELLKAGDLKGAAALAVLVGDDVEQQLIAEATGCKEQFRKALIAARVAQRKRETEARGLIADKTGSPLPGFENMRRILSGESGATWDGVLGYDVFSSKITLFKPIAGDTRPESGKYPREFNMDQDGLVVLSWIQTNEFPSISLTLCFDAISAAAQTHPFHPVKEYLLSLRWDKQSRAKHLWPYFFAVEIKSDIPGHQDYVEQAGERFLISAVARIMEPGCKVDSMPVLVSDAQGYFKSTGLRLLVGTAWFSDNMPKIGEKDSYDHIQGVWIVEMAEMHAIQGAAAEAVKKFLSSANDRHRPSYGRGTRDFPRQTVFVGTGNERTYLSDTENRRFWPLTVGGQVRRAEIEKERDQLWAEAVHLYQQRHRWWFDQEEMPALKAEQAEARIVDGAEEKIREHLRGLSDDARILGYEIARDVLDIRDPDKSSSMRIARYMKACGWSNKKPIGIKSGGLEYYRRGPDAEPYQSANTIVVGEHEIPAGLGARTPVRH